MKITAQEEYGLRCILQLVKLGGESAPVQVPNIAQAEGLSVPYAEKLLRILAQGGLTESVRGAKGGYKLTRPLEQISLGDVLRILGETPDPQQMCQQYTGTLDACVHTDNCSVRHVWSYVATSLNSFFDSIPLSQLLASGPPERLLPANLLSSRRMTPLRLNSTEPARQYDNNELNLTIKE